MFNSVIQKICKFFLRGKQSVTNNPLTEQQLQQLQQLQQILEILRQQQPEQHRQQILQILRQQQPEQQLQQILEILRQQQPEQQQRQQILQVLTIGNQPGGQTPKQQLKEILQILPTLQQRAAQVLTIIKSGRNPEELQQEILQELEQLQDEQTLQIIQILQGLNDRQLQKILQIEQQQPDRTELQQILKILKNEPEDQQLQLILQELQKRQQPEDQQLQLILRELQRRQQQLLQLQQTTITEEVINEVDTVIKDFVNQIKTLNADDIEIFNKKLDKLTELKKVLHNSSNSDSVNHIISEFIEFINHDYPNVNSATTRNKDDQGKAVITNAARYLYLLRNSTQSLEGGKIHDPALGLELYRTYRSRIEYEGTLLNQRVTWFLVTQGFLFTAFATAISTTISLPIFIFLLAISITGLGYSALISNPISLSVLAVHSLKNEWVRRSNVNSGFVTDQVKKLLPEQVCFDTETTSYKPGYSNWVFGIRSISYRRWINWIPRMTGIIWVVLAILVISLRQSYPLLPWNWFWRNPSYLTINTPNLSQDRDNINEAKLGLRAAICLTKHKDKKDKYEQVLAIKPTGNPFFNLSQRSANEYVVDSVTVPVLRENKKGNYETKKLKLTSKEGKLQSCEE